MISGTVLKFAIDSSSVQGQHHQDEMHLLFNLLLLHLLFIYFFKDSMQFIAQHQVAINNILPL